MAELYYCYLWYGTTQPNEGYFVEWWVRGEK